ncbi:hypothetical protein BU26DRAFT_74421 [Trematosphaeria pertusa]|uniref:Cupin type-2 domain-containing protein n=1 Tax=Trematosphaeria pertusa TaxID=390896 RepID=A0A6A6I5D1_9PLEO|nr:uncharacterized protein BU26DRAFT_74421 [Trematosphaeria pertusa]KAF2245725.1 hypothetical protein BU26DRAFT_74421 [Trematosphaeria pertusa]
MTSGNKPPPQESPLPSINRFITAHDHETRKAVFSTALPEKNPTQVVPGAVFRQGYVTKAFPVELNNDADLNIYKSFLESPPGIVASGGTVLRVVDMHPNFTSPMHRTVSLDYGIVIEGEVDLVLDSGETKTLKRGDIAVQRGTMHAWRNNHKTEWARVVFILQPSRPVVAGSEELGEDYGDMEGVKLSD